MDMTGEYRIPAPRQRVWEALNDPEVLKAAIPGCDELVKKSDTELEARVTAKVGPVSAKFGGAVTLGDLNPPESYTISGQGSGGAAGFAKGGATVRLTEDGSDTILRYEAKAEVGGKLAQIGSRLIQGTARKMADEFFGKFSSIVTQKAAAEAAAAAASAPAVPAPAFPAPDAPAAAPAPAPEPISIAPVPAPAAVAPPPRPVPPAPPAYQPPQPPAGLAQSPFVWLGSIIVLLLLLFWIFA